MKYEIKKVLNCKIFLIAIVIIIAGTIYNAIEMGLARQNTQISQFEEGDYASSVMAFRDRVVDNAEYLISISKKKNDRIINEYNVRYYSKDISLKQDMNLSLERMLVAYDNMYVVDALTLIMLVILIVYLFVSEHSNETYILNFSSLKGRWQQYIKKFAVISIFTVLVIALEIVVTNIVAIIAGNGISFNEVIQQCDYARESPFSMNYIQYVLCVLGMKIIGFLFLAALFSLVAACFHRIWIPAFIGLIYGAIRTMSYKYMSENMRMGRLTGQTWNEITYYINNYTVLGFNFEPGQYMKKFAWNLSGNTPFLSQITVIILGVTGIIALVFLGSRIYSGRNRC